MANAGLREEDFKYVYLAGGLTTLLTLAVIGRLSDHLGKLPVFRVLALATWHGRIGESLWFGTIDLGWQLHPLVLMFALSGSLMISKTLHIPKP